MAPQILISFDGTDNDYDALALGRLFARAGGEVSIAYVRHSQESERHREELAHEEAARLLDRGAAWIGLPDVPRHVVVSASTSEGLRALAAEHGADVIVFGSEYRTAPGHIAPQVSTRRLLERSSTAIAIAPARLQDRSDARLGRVVVLDGDQDDAALQTARSLAGDRAGHGDQVDLLVIGSRADARVGNVQISSASERRIEEATSAVLILPRGRGVAFEAPVTA
ncbi:MAG TPA: universal stress protein [Solirubrobacteraceae bacterium]|jgi:nucleotide-binding universal stress UspA family protein|nr:universal stress protein [Solirubrobacteraceae bacterium]